VDGEYFIHEFAAQVLSFSEPVLRGLIHFGMDLNSVKSETGETMVHMLVKQWICLPPYTPGFKRIVRLGFDPRKEDKSGDISLVVGIKRGHKFHALKELIPEPLPHQHEQEKDKHLLGKCLSMLVLHTNMCTDVVFLQTLILRGANVSSIDVSGITFRLGFSSNLMLMYYAGYNFPQNFPRQVNCNDPWNGIQCKQEMGRFRLWLEKKGRVPSLQRMAAVAVLRVYEKEEVQKLGDIELSDEIKKSLFLFH
jgi:hypothetical protein